MKGFDSSSQLLTDKRSENDVNRDEDSEFKPFVENGPGAVNDVKRVERIERLLNYFFLNSDSTRRRPGD